MIPQCNPHAGYLANKKEIDAAMSRVLNSGWYILGKEVEAFEREFAAWLGVKHAVGVANGTDAIELALRAAGVQYGDQVATVSHTAVATIAAIRRCGAVPLFIDIEPDFFTMDPHLLEASITVAPKVKAVVVVHLYGQMADMPPILEIAKKYKLAVIEDCAQAHGASLHDKKAGLWGDFGCFSFYPTKNLGALGDGGAIVTKDKALADSVVALRQYGWNNERISRNDGVNSRLDELQATVLRVRLRGLDKNNYERQEIANIYRKGLQYVESIVTPALRDGCEHIYHQFVIQIKNRKQLKEKLTQKGIATAIHYAKPAHLHPAYFDKKSTTGSLTHTESIVGNILSLPMFPELSTESTRRVVDEIQSILK